VERCWGLGVAGCWVLGAGLVVLGIYRSAVPDYTVLNCKWISVDGGGWVDGWMARYHGEVYDADADG